MNIRIWGTGLALALSLSVGLGAVPARAGDLILGGQEHEYKVIFRGDGRAIVLGEMVIPNAGTEEVLKSVTVHLSVSDAEQMVAYQVLGTRTPYAKMTVTEGNDDAFTFTFPTPLEANSGGMIRFAYTSREYTKTFLGLTSYRFETPTIDSNINQVAVYVQTDSDLALVGKNTTIEYGKTVSATNSALEDSGIVSLSDAEALGSALRSRQGNTVYESATNLFPGESYVVKGRYSEHAWRLYLGHMMIVVLVLALLAGLFAWKYRGETRQKFAMYWAKVKRATVGGPVMGGLIAAAAVSAWLILLTETRLMHFMRGGDVTEVLSIIVVIMIFVLLSIGPAFHMGVQRGWRSGVATFIWQIVWILVGIVLVNLIDDGGVRLMLD